jgi:hypothetical protein
MFSRDMVFLRNISVDTLHKGDTEDVNNDDDDDDSLIHALHPGQFYDYGNCRRALQYI